MHYGSLPAFSIYGCWEIAGDEFPDGVSTWPFSLVAESTAEVYVIQKQERWAGLFRVNLDQFLFDENGGDVGVVG